MESLRIALPFKTRDPEGGKESLPMPAVGKKAGAQETGAYTEVSSLKVLPICLNLEPHVRPLGYRFVEQ